MQCIHPTLKLDTQILRQLRLLERCLRQFDPQQTIIHWEMRLEALIAHLAPKYRFKVAKNLQLADDGIARLKNLSQIQNDVIVILPTYQRPSQIVHLLQKYNLPTLILTAIQSPRKIRKIIWKYLTVWSNVQPLLNGNDLKNLGYKPEPQYRQILDELLSATLDGFIQDKTEAEEFLKSNYLR